MMMDLRTLARDLKHSLSDAASLFASSEDADDGEFKRLIQLAAADLCRVRPRIVMGVIYLQPGVADYDCPADLIDFRRDYWHLPLVPWEDGFPRQPVRVTVVQTPAGRKLRLTPWPSHAHLAAFGAAFDFDYFAAHSVDADAARTTVLHADRHLLLLRAQVEAMKELAVRNMRKPVQLRDGAGFAAKNGTPAALYEQLMDEFTRQAK